MIEAIPAPVRTVLLLTASNAAGMSLGQLKIVQEVVTLVVFVPFAFFFMKQPLRLDFLWAGLCMLGAVYFIFRSA
jgi:uncharacterized protein (DUF486 family)